MPPTKTPTICIVAGEASGDILGGRLAQALRLQDPRCQLLGVGSTHMKNAGVEILIDSEQLAVVGLMEIIVKFKVLRDSFRTLVNLFATTPPDLLILIDYPGFNLRLATKAKKFGIKVMYYVSPQIWAWHYSRIKRIKRDIDKMAVLFPFEKRIYEREGVPVDFVGHPLVESIKPTLPREEALRQFKLNPTNPIIGLLPGSRRHEIERLLPDMLAATKLLKKQYPTAQFVLPLAANLSSSALSSYDLSEITLVQHHTYNAIQLCDAAIVASGTVTLEVGLLKVPMVIVYKMNALNVFIAKFIAGLKEICAGEKCFGLCNIVAEERLMPELLQNAVTPEAIYQCIVDLLQNQTKRDYIQQKLLHLNDKLCSPAASEKAALTALQLLG